MSPYIIMAKDHYDVRRINDKLCVRERIVCADGFSFSCQHSYHHYCNLYRIKSSKYDYEYRKTSNLDINENTTFEIMFKLCSQRATKKLHKYKCKSESLYVNVPHDVVIDLINYHGGLLIKNSPHNNKKQNSRA